MNTEDELALLAAEEASLQFSLFNADTAWEIGSELKAEAEQRGVAVSIDIQLAGHTLFHYAMLGTSPDNAEWIRRKRNVVNRFHKSS
ncbi:heme-binding protein, partial [Obesumbacterium proteus]|uniref:heme-binding protein n=1 Tax=Obesumbacterium proteus TaxID=82983 RepID=UPI00242D7887